MKKYIILVMIFLILPSILAINLNVTKQSSDEAMILGVDSPAIFDLSIKNEGASDNFMIYTYFGSSYLPTEKIAIDSGETKQIQFKVSPPYTISRTGAILFTYYIKGFGSDIYEDQLLVKVVDLGEALKIGSDSIDPETNSIKIYIQNKINFNFDNLNVVFSSPFFNLEKNIALAPNEKKTFDITLNKEDFKKMNAGFYTLSGEVVALNKSANLEGIINFVEKYLNTTNIKTKGFIIRTKKITKTNEGNTLETVHIEEDKGIISRLFTSFTTEPDNVVRNNSKVHYDWNEELNPGESLEVKVKTNWFLPLIFVLLVVGTVIFVREYTKTDLRLRKKITFVKSKGGEFALKISLVIEAKKNINNLLIIEKIPPLLTLYEKFGQEHPVRINTKTKVAEWEFKKLEAGEKRLISYVIYSKVGVLGRFALPRTNALYEVDGKLQKTKSNRVFFLTEQESNKNL